MIGAPEATLTGNAITLFLVVLARVGGLVVSAPILSDMQVPRPVKVVLSLVLSFVLVQTPRVAGARVPVDLAPFALLVLAQLVVGLVLGFVARTIFLAVQTAGGIVSLQTGLSMASVLNPLTRQPDPVISQLYTLVASITFLAVNGDAWLVASLARSFDLAPLTAASASPTLLSGVITDTLAVTGIGLQIALPIAASLFAANIVLGVVSRSMPQLNVYVLSMPLNLILGLLALIAALGGTVLVIGHLTGQLPHMMLDPLMRHG